MTRQEWERVLQSLTVNTMSTLEAGTHPLVTARRQKAAAFLTEAGFPGLLRHYAMARFYKELLPTLALEQIVLHNLVDGSGLALVLLNYEKELFSFVFGVQMPYGKRASEFGLLAEERQVKLQIKVDF